MDVCKCVITNLLDIYNYVSYIHTYIYLQIIFFVYLSFVIIIIQLHTVYKFI